MSGKDFFSRRKSGPPKAKHGSVITFCKRCGRAIYSDQERQWATGDELGLVHAVADQCGPGPDGAA